MRNSIDMQVASYRCHGSNLRHDDNQFVFTNDWTVLSISLNGKSNDLLNRYFYNYHHNNTKLIIVLQTVVVVSKALQLELVSVLG